MKTTTTAKPLILHFGNLSIELARYRVMLSNTQVNLSYKDYGLLVYLASRAGQVVSKRQLLEEGMGRHDPIGVKAVDERVRYLRLKLESESSFLIKEVDGSGYRLDPASN